MTIFIDLIGSWFVRASLVGVMLTLAANMNDAVYQSAQVTNAKGHISVVDSVIYADVNAAGYLVPSTDTTFKSATSGNLRFYADIDLSGTVEDIKYLSVYNPTTNCYSLTRTINSGTAMDLGNDFTNITFKYYSAAGSEITNPWDYSKIRQVRVMLSVRADNVTSADSTISTDFSTYPPNLL